MTNRDIMPIREVIHDIDFSVFYRVVLSGIPVYKNTAVNVASMSIEDSRVLVNKVIESRFLQAKQLVQKYITIGLKPFEPIAIRRNSRQFAIISPPVAEWFGEWFVTDGSHRMLAAYHAAMKDVIILTIRGGELPLPASKPFFYDKLEVVHEVAHWTERTVDFEPQLFRPVPMVIDKLSEQRFERTGMKQILDEFQSTSTP